MHTNTGTSALSDKKFRVSVCMATYNGERYIQQQLESILLQLSVDDEIIIVDDASTDRSRERVTALRDPRIRLLVNKENRGVLASFEKALLDSTGEIIFFSDQDDIWKLEKVSTVLEAFAQHPDAMLIASDSSVINEDGCVIADSYYSTRSSFATGVTANVIHFRYQGCSMAMRRTLIPDILPFPHGFNLLHDVWIGLRASVAGHKVLFLEQSLFFYRRHSSNNSYTLPRRHQIKVRVHLIAALTSDVFRRAFARVLPCRTVK